MVLGARQSSTLPRAAANRANATTANVPVGPASPASDAYTVLGLDAATASPIDVKKAYRTRALRVHPDRLPASSANGAAASPVHAPFAELQAAYEIAVQDQADRQRASTTTTTANAVPDAAAVAAATFSKLESRWVRAAQEERDAAARMWLKMTGHRAPTKRCDRPIGKSSTRVYLMPAIQPKKTPLQASSEGVSRLLF